MAEFNTEGHMDDFDGFWLSMFVALDDSQRRRVVQLLTTFLNTGQLGDAVASSIASLHVVPAALQGVSHDPPRFSQASTIAPFQITGGLDSYADNRGIASSDQSNSKLLMPAPSFKGDPPTPKKRFFCTTCLENGVYETFGAKSDCKRHELTFHETGYDYYCRFPGCREVFSRQQDAYNHRLEHVSMDGQQYHTVPLHRRQIHACGFESCSTFKTSWVDLFDHKARHMKKADMNWSRTTRVLNLMRHKLIKPTWKSMKRSLQQRGFNVSQLIWDPTTTRYLVRQLECLNFSPDSSESSYGFAPDLPSLLQQLGAIGSTAAAPLTGKAVHTAALEALEGTSLIGASHPEFARTSNDMPTALYESTVQDDRSVPESTTPFLGFDNVLDAPQVSASVSRKQDDFTIPDGYLHSVNGSPSLGSDTLFLDFDDTLDLFKGPPMTNPNRYSVIMEDASPCPVDEHGCYTSIPDHSAPFTHDPLESIVNNQNLGSWPLPLDAPERSPPRTTAPRHTAGNAGAPPKNLSAAQRPSTSQNNIASPSDGTGSNPARNRNIFTRHYAMSRRPATSHGTTS